MISVALLKLLGNRFGSPQPIPEAWFTRLKNAQ